MHPLISPAKAWLFFVPTVIFSIIIPVIGVAFFTYIIAKRMAPLVRSQPDFRFDNFKDRGLAVLKLWLGQWRQPRYMTAGILHIIIFAGFCILSIRSTSLVFIGVNEHFVVPGFGGIIGDIYNVLKDYAATGVFVACIIAAYRRGITKPARYAVPEKYGKDHTAEAIFVLALICTLMVSESLFEATHVAAQAQKNMTPDFLAPFTLVWVFKLLLSSAAVSKLQVIHLIAYYVHDLTFFFFLCFLPMGKHFHVITSVFNVFFMRLKKGNIKPVKYGVPDDKLDELESFGVKKIEDFTWKNILDFYSCADCGRCSDQCPANLVKRPLSPRFISIKARDLIFKNYPLKGDFLESQPLIGDIYDEDEIWSCTTCGACEEECPLGIEYINKIVDLRRGMVDEGEVPQSLQKPLKALEKRGNPWGKMEKKRADWTKDLPEGCKVNNLEKGGTANTLYFVDSISSFDDRMQDLAKASAQILCAAGEDFGILGKLEKDSGNEIRRFGEEMLFQTMKEMNTEAILGTEAQLIVTADPHAFNALKNDYNGDLPPVKHLCQYVNQVIKEGRIRLSSIEDPNKVYTYHDPCYLGRHNGLYDEPRQALDAIPGLKRVEMEGKCKDRSLCCGGGGLMLFYEPEEELRMGVLRVEMAEKAGANVIVTACPFCLVNMEDAIKVSGREGKIEAIDLSELICRHLAK